MKKLGRPTEERRDLWNIIADNNFSINGQNGLTLVIENVNSGPTLMLENYQKYYLALGVTLRTFQSS